MVAFLPQELRVALRGLARNPGWTAVAVISLALGIGANTAVFSFVDAVLLRPFPYPDTERMVFIWGTKSADVKRGLGLPTWQEYLGQARSFEDMAGVQLFTDPVSFGDGDSGSVVRALVTPNLFSFLRTRPLRGRGFEGLSPDTEHVAVISYSLWQSRFGGEESVIGRTVRLGEYSYEIVGVMPPEFFFPDHNVQVWIPAPRTFPVHMVARLKEGVSPQQAQAELDSITASLAETGQVARGTEPGLFPLLDIVIGQYRTALWTLLGAVGLVLLIGCVNVANLLMARGVTREKELAVRVTLGASRWKIFRQLLTESLLLAVLGGVLGVLLAGAGLDAIRALGLRDIPRMDRAALDGRVLLFSLGLSLVTGLVFGVIPAWRASRPNLNESLKQGGMNAGRAGRSGVRDLLVSVEFALTVVLLVTSGLLIHSFIRLARLDWGFRPENVLVVTVQPPALATTSDSNQREYMDQVLGRLKTVPGVESAAVSYVVPLDFITLGLTYVAVDGRPVTTYGWKMWNIGYVGPGYFRTMGIPLIRGREFTSEDDSSARLVVVVSQALADKLWPDEDPVGKEIQFADLNIPGTPRVPGKIFRPEGTLDEMIAAKKAEFRLHPPREVVGVAGNVRMFGLEFADEPVLYVGTTQELRRGLFQIALRTSGDPTRFADAAKAVIIDVNNGAAIRKMETMEELVRDSIGGRGTSKLLLVVAVMFGTLAVVLAASGIYGVMAHAVTQRTQEMGVRVALGAQRGDIFRLVLGQGMRLVLSGAALGVTGAWAATRVLKTLLFGITPTDVPTYAAVLTFLILVALVACWVPARRATRVDPMVALRYE